MQPLMTNQTHIHNAKSYSQFFKYASQPCSFIYAKDKIYPYGKAAQIEVSGSNPVEQLEYLRDGSSVRLSRSLHAQLNASAKRTNQRTFAVLSYNDVIGFICLDSSGSTLYLDNARRHAFSHQTNEHVNQWIGAVNHVADSMAQAA